MKVTKEYLTHLAPAFFDDNEIAELKKTGELEVAMRCALDGVQTRCPGCGRVFEWVNGIGWQEGEDALCDLEGVPAA
jgi:hypothetical protein